MTKTKYGKYILTEAGAKKTPAAAVAPVTLAGLKDWGGVKARMHWNFVSAPAQIFAKPHSHDFDELLIFLSCDPANASDFSAEIELSLGREGEKQVIKSPTIVCLPKGLVHGPLSFKSVGKPVLYTQVYLSADYVEKPAA